MSQHSINNGLFDSQKSLFRPIQQKQLENIAPEESIIISQFSIEDQNIELKLSNNSIKLTFQNGHSQYSFVSYQLALNHQIKVAQISQKNDYTNYKSGFSLFIDHDLKYNFKTSDSNMLLRWMRELSKLLFLQGFSQDFKAVNYIGRGEFGQVWEVQRNSDGKKFAAKIIDKEICFGQVNGKQAVYNEIQILRKINHQNIVHLECVYESEKNLYIVQEFLQGKLLSQFIKQFKDSSSTTSTIKLQKHHNIKIMKNLLKAVDYLHKKGIAHRDLKPGNIIINSQTKMPCIFDFGLSEFINKEEYLFQYCGSPGFMAPQIFQGQKIKDLTKCDIFSLGAIFFMLLAQTPLFDGSSTQEIIDMTKLSKKFIQKKIKSSFSGSQAKLLLSMLEENPQKRITAEEALSHQFFTQAVYDFLQQIRKLTSEGDQSSKYSLKVENIHSKFEELLGDSAVVTENKFNFHNFLNEEDEQNLKSSRNMVTPSDHYTEKIKRRVNRYMSEENIDIEPEEDKINKSTWSGKWRKIKTFEEMLFGGHFWPVKDFIFQAK